eukprot:jgi/Picre1/32949/NNA_008276.t1
MGESVDRNRQHLADQFYYDDDVLLIPEITRNPTVRNGIFWCERLLLVYRLREVKMMVHGAHRADAMHPVSHLYTGPRVHSGRMVRVADRKRPWIHNAHPIKADAMGMEELKSLVDSQQKMIEKQQAMIEEMQEMMGSFAKAVVSGKDTRDRSPVLDKLAAQDDEARKQMSTAAIHDRRLVGLFDARYHSTSTGATPRDHRILPKKIILVRHAESEGNVNNQAYTYLPDPQVPLTKTGWRQAFNAGKMIKDIASDSKLFFYTSPYLRSKQTYEGVSEAFGVSNIAGVQEEVQLREQDFGNFQDAEGSDERKPKGFVLEDFSIDFRTVNLEQMCMIG